MSFSTVLIIAFAAGAILVVGGGLMVYMGNLVRSAYEIKVQINNDVDERLNKMAEDLDKKSRWIKRDLLEEIGKIKEALHTDSARKIGELADPLNKRLDALENMLRTGHADLVKAVDADRAAIAAMDQRLKTLRPKAEAPPAAEAPIPAAATADKPAEAAPPPAKAAGPQPISDTLQNLG